VAEVKVKVVNEDFICVVIDQSAGENAAQGGQLRQQLPHYRIFEYYTQPNRHDEDLQTQRFEEFKKEFETKYGHILIMTRKGSVGMDIQNSVDVMQVTLTADDETQIQQFNRRCRRNVREIIIHTREKLSTNQQNWFRNKWDRVCTRITPGISLNDFYCKRIIGKDEKGNDKNVNCVLVHNPHSGAALYCGGIFLKMANLHENFSFDNVFYGVEDFEGYCHKFPKTQAYNYDCSVRRLDYDWDTKVKDNTCSSLVPFTFTTNGYSYSWDIVKGVQRLVFADNFEFIEHLQQLAS
jgi:hypothetical protein